MNFEPPLSFDTQRLTLRKPKRSDARVIFEAYAQDSEVARYLSWKPHRALPETRQFLVRSLARWSNATQWSYCICLKPEGRLMGMIGFTRKEHSVCCGYVLARKEWGQGYASEALRAIVIWAVAHPLIYRIWACCGTENKASSRVMEKAGMEYEGKLRRWTVLPNLSTEPADCLAFSKVK